MQSIEKHIIDLFRKHDCIIVPDFGGFLLTYKSARFSPSGDELLPPTRFVSFNRSLSTNDGLLASSIANKDNISYSEAITQISDKVKNWKEQLNASKEVRIDDVGVISLNNDSKWQFQPASTQNFLTSSFGLSTLLIRLEEAPQIIDLSDEKDHVFKINTKRSFGVPRTLAIAASLLIFIGFSGVLFNNYFQSFSGLAAIGNVFHKEAIVVTPEAKKEVVNESTKPVASTSTESITPATKETTSPAEPITETPIPIKEQPVEVKKEVVKVEETPVPVVSKHSHSPAIKEEENLGEGFYVIGGSFTMKSNAIRFVKILKSKGYTPELLHNKEGMFRVSYKMDSDSMAADSYLKEIRQDGTESAWLLHLN